jgi:hypothetical protein
MPSSTPAGLDPVTLDIRAGFIAFPDASEAKR